jgi:hypothetical protein
MVMCSIRAKPCFIHICRLCAHPHWLSHVSHGWFCVLWVWCLYCICMYWNYFMHVHARIECLRVHARIPSLACLCTCLLVSKAERAFASVCFYWGMSVYLRFHGLSREVSKCTHVSACIQCCCLHVPREVFVGMFQDLSVRHHSVSCVESWACVCMFPWELSVCLHVSRADHASSFSWLSMCLLISRAESVCVCVCMCLHVSMAERVCVCMYLNVSGAERMCACACTYRELRECVHVSAHIWGVHVSAHIEGWAHVFLCLPSSRL